MKSKPNIGQLWEHAATHATREDIHVHHRKEEWAKTRRSYYNVQTRPRQMLQFCRGWERQQIRTRRTWRATVQSAFQYCLHPLRILQYTPQRPPLDSTRCSFSCYYFVRFLFLERKTNWDQTREFIDEIPLRVHWPSVRS